LSNATAALKKEIAIIPAGLQDMEGKLEETHSLIREFGEKQTVTSSHKPDEIRDVSIATGVLAKSSAGGLLFMHALFLAEKHKIGIDLEALSKSVGFLNPDYLDGFLVAVYSAGLVDYNRSGNILSKVDINDTIGKGAKEEFIKRAGAVDNEAVKKAWKEGLDKVESRVRPE